MVSRLVLVLGVLALAWGGAAAADQRDGRLDELFRRLQATGDATEARAIELAIWSIWTEANDAEIDARMTTGVAAMQAGALETALATFDRVVRKAPRFAEGWNKRATVYYYLGRYDESVADVRRTLELEPRHFGALSGLGLIMLAIGDEAKALEAMEGALRVHPHLSGVQAKVRELRDKLRGKPI